MFHKRRKFIMKKKLPLIITGAVIALIAIQ